MKVTIRWPAARQRHGNGRALERALWIGAACCLGYAAWMAADAGIYQLRASRRLDSLVAQARDGAALARPVGIAAGDPIGRLSIPSLDLEVVLAEGIDERVLRRAVGHLPASAWFGADGNVVLAGHRDTFLRELEHARAGHIVVLESELGRHEYRIEWTRVVEPDAVEVLDEAGYPALTIVTCYPFRYVGPAPRRFIVRARRVDVTV